MRNSGQLVFGVAGAVCAAVKVRISQHPCPGSRVKPAAGCYASIYSTFGLMRLITQVFVECLVYPVTPTSSISSFRAERRPHLLKKHGIQSGRANARTVITIQSRKKAFWDHHLIKFLKGVNLLKAHYLNSDTPCVFELSFDSTIHAYFDKLIKHLV